jgi:hypothetical protein
MPEGMLQEDFERLHKFLLETEDLSEVSDDIRELVEEEWPELVHKLPPKVALVPFTCYRKAGHSARRKPVSRSPEEDSTPIAWHMAGAVR